VLSIHRSGSDLQTLADGWWPVVSPNGKRVAFVSGNDIGYVAPLAGGTAKLVARRVDSPFVWSPDGTELAYLGADSRVHVAAANGKQRRAVTDAYARLGSLAWRPQP
jgi:Tol biopolymer transport system component